MHYRQLPEENNKLYTRRFAVLKLDNLSEKPQIDDSETLEEFGKMMQHTTNINFDAIIGNSFALIKNNAELKFVNGESAIFAEAIKNSMFSNDEDKYVSFIRSKSKHALFINIEEHKKSDIKLLFANIKEPLNLQIFVDIGGNSKLCLFEWHSSNASINSMAGVVREIKARPGSESEITIIHNEDENTTVLNNTKADVSDMASLKMNDIYIGGKSSRVKNKLNASGRKSTIKSNEIVFGSGKQIFDINSEIQNSGNESNAFLSSRVAMAQSSLCYLKGFAKVQNGAVESNSFVEENSMIIDKTARIDSLPSMSIDENSIKAGHSSAIGPINDESMFYLMSRAIDFQKARELLISSFFSPSIKNLESGIAKAAVSSLISEKIKDRKGVFTKIGSSDIIWLLGNESGQEKVQK